MTKNSNGKTFTSAPSATRRTVMAAPSVSGLAARRTTRRNRRAARAI